jgi:Lysylphosphatidylglycerol synthase TM region
MQNTTNPLPQTSFLKENLFLFLKLMLFAGIVWAIVEVFKNKEQHLSNLLAELQKILTLKNLPKLLFAGVLVIANWGFEALKWQKLAQKITKITYLESFKSVLLGLSLGFFLPAVIGDSSAKVYKLKTQRKAEGVGVVLLGNGIQFFITMLFGTIAYLKFANDFPEVQVNFGGKILYILLIISTLFGFIFFFRLFYFSKILAKRFNFFSVNFTVFEEFSFKDIVELFIIATLRYLVFTIQFLLTLSIFQVDLPVTTLIELSSLVFFAKTVIPALHFISDLGIRELSALFFFGYYEIEPAKVVSATLMVWLINILFPVVIGSLLVLFSRKK